MAEQEAGGIPSSRIQAPLPDVAVSAPRYEEPPPPVFPSGPLTMPTEDESSHHEEKYSESGESPVNEVPPTLDFEEPVKEETSLDAVQNPMVVPKTQPIRVKANSTALPPRRSEAGADGGGDLPRLDVSLADGDSKSAAAALIHDGSDTNRGPTRIQLPQLGESSDATSPEDFAHPSAPPAHEESPAPEPEPPALENPVPPAAPPVPPLVVTPPVPSIPEAPLASEIETPPALGEIPSMEEIGGEIPPALEEEPISVEEPPVQEMPPQSRRVTEAIPLAPVSATAPEVVSEEVVPDQPEYTAPATPPQVEAPQLEAVSQEHAEVPVPPQEDSIVEAEPAPPVYHSLRVPENKAAPPSPAAEEAPEEGEEYEQSTGEGSIGNLIGAGTRYEEQSRVATPGAGAGSPAAVVSPQSTAAPASVESSKTSSPDEWDALLGDSDDEAKPGRTAIVMLSVIGAVAIVTVVVVYFVAQALGGFSLPEKDPVADAEAQSQKPPTNTKPVGSEVTSAVNGDPVVPKKIEIPGNAETAATRSASGDSGPPKDSPVSLPFDYSPLKIQDPNSPATEPKSESAGAGETAQSPPASSNPGLEANTLTGQSSDDAAFQSQVNTILNGGATDLTGSSTPGAADPLKASPDPVVIPPGPADSFPSEAASTATAAALAAQEPKETFPDTFPAPGADDATGIAGTREIIKAFLEAANWSERVKYIYQGESLRPALEEYYKKWPDTKLDRYSLQFYEIERNAEVGGPYWMYFMSTSDNEDGIPIIVRVEDGNLKIDWEIFSEFQDRHFAKFIEGGIASPHTFRLVCERKSDYYGTDRDGFENLDDYLVFEVFPPYGVEGEFTEPAFVKKGSPVAEKLGKILELGELPLGVIVTLDWKAFPHGIKHVVITDYVTEGWFK